MLKQFEDWLTINFKEENTRRSYFERISNYFKYSKGKINQQTLNDYLKYLRDENKAQSTYGLFLTAIRKYVEFSKIELEIPKGQKIKNKIKDYITVDKLENDIIPMLSLLFNDYNKQELILRTLFFSGMRKSELVNLKREHVNFEENKINIHDGKSGSRTVPLLCDKTTQQIKEYFQYYPEEQNAFNIKQYNINYLTRRINKELNLNINFTPHVLRASFAKYCNDIGFSTSDIKYLMGHSDIKQTEAYIQSDERAVLKKAEQLRR